MGTCTHGPRRTLCMEIRVLRGMIWSVSSFVCTTSTAGKTPVAVGSQPYQMLPSHKTGLCRDIYEEFVAFLGRMQKVDV